METSEVTKELTEAWHLIFDVKDANFLNENARMAAHDALQALNRLSVALTGKAMPQRYDGQGRRAPNPEITVKENEDGSIEVAAVVDGVVVAESWAYEWNDEWTVRGCFADNYAVQEAVRVTLGTNREGAKLDSEMGQFFAYTPTRSGAEVVAKIAVRAATGL